MIHLIDVTAALCLGIALVGLVMAGIVIWILVRAIKDSWDADQDDNNDGPRMAV